MCPQPVEHVGPKLTGSNKQVIGVLLRNRSRVTVKKGMSEIGTCGEMNQNCFMCTAQCEFQRVDPKRVMARRSLLEFISADVESELAQQQRGVVGVGEFAIVAEAGHRRVREFTIHNAQQSSHLGDSGSVVIQVTDLQPGL